MKGIRPQKVLITGATGLIGKRLVSALEARGHEVKILSRNPQPGQYFWNPEKGIMDEKAFENLDAIIHLAGAPISKPWNKHYQKKIYDSRVKSCELLYEYAKRLNSNLSTFLTASGSNYYDATQYSTIWEETDPPGEDFLANLCVDLELTAKKFEKLGSRVCAVRTSAVLADEGGMIQKLKPLAKWNILSPLGSGKQRIPWIHIEDLVQIYIHLLENPELEGAFNAAATEKVSNREFTKAFMKSMSRKMIFPPVPAFLIKLLLGDMSFIVLKGSDLSNNKIKSTGFSFQYDQLKLALKNLQPIKNR